MALTPEGTPYVESTDLVANYPAASLSLANRVDLVGVLPFANAAARTTAIPTPTDGQYSYLQDTNATEFYNGAAWVGAGNEKVLQVVSATKNDTFTTASTSYVDITGLSVSITPSSATNKILVLTDIFISNSGTTGDRATFAQLVRGATAISVGAAAGSRIPVSTAIFMPDESRISMSASTIFLDSPATTSATTYKIQLRATGNTATLNRWGDDTDTASYPRAASNITVMEIKA
jgi:hypothetical protein